MSTEQENANNKVTLYIATHNKTGLKYFGKTAKYFTQEDLQKYYHGSGKYWNNHIKKHGDDVTMEIYGIYSLDEVKEIALKFSEENNIVENYVNWANMKPENGLDGWVKGTKKSEISKEKLRRSISNMSKKAKEEKYKKVIDTLNKDILGEDGIITSSNKIKAKKYTNTIMKNIVKEDGIITTIAKEKGRKTSYTLNKPKEINKKITTIAKDRGRLLSKLVTEEYVDNVGNTTTLAKEQAKKRTKNMNKEQIIKGNLTTLRAEVNKLLREKGKERGRKYDIIKDNKTLIESVPYSTVRNISQALFKNKPMGTTKMSRSKLKQNGQEFLIGCTIRLSFNQNFYTNKCVGEIINILKGELNE